MIDMIVTVNNFEIVQGKLHRFPRTIDKVIRQSLKDYFNQDFRPMLSKGIKGFKLPNVPARNAPLYAEYKARRWGVTHSLGYLSGRMHEGAMAVKPEVRTVANRTVLKANFDNIPSGSYPYLPVVHEGLDNLSQAYPFVEGVRMVTHNRMMQRVEAGLSTAWNRTDT